MIDATRLKSLLRKEFLQMLRDPRMRMIVFVMPVVQMLLFAFALTTDVTDVEIALLDYDRSPLSRDLADAFTSSGWFRIRERLESQTALDAALDAGRVRGAVVIPPTFSRNAASGRDAKIQVLADGVDSNSAGVIFGYANTVVGTFANREQDKLIERTLGRDAAPPKIEVETRAFFNPNLESKYFYIPGLIAIMLLATTLQLPSIAVVREKELGAIEQLMITPITRSEFILGKTIPYMAAAYAVMGIMFGLARVVFGVSVVGDPLLLVFVTGIYLAGNLGLALLISTTAGTQQQALLTAFLALMPINLLSGFLFPVRNMPEIIQWVDVLNPMRWYLDALRAVAIKGQGIESIREALLWMSGLALAFLALAVLRFKKTID